MSLTCLGPEEIADRLYRSDHIHRPLPSLDAFDEEAVRRYQQDGFIAIENVLSPVDVQSGLDGVTSLIIEGDPKYIQFEEAGKDKDLSPQQREAYVRKCMWFVKHEPRLNALVNHPNLQQVVRTLVGSDVELLQDMALLKPPLVGREKPWHQDSAYFSYGPANLLIGTWVALDEATVENGCMHVIPGSHHAGGVAHYLDRDCQLPDEIIKVDQDVVVPLKPGGVLFFSALLHHGTPPNQSPQRRRAVQFHYRSIHAHELNREEFERMFHDTKGVAGCTGGHHGYDVRPISSAEL